MKLKATTKRPNSCPGSDKGIFDGIVIAVLGNSPFTTKQTLRKKITSEGGTISYMITSKCHFLVCADGSSTEEIPLSAAHIIQKHQIPVVPIQFIDLCLAEGKLLPFKNFLKGINDQHEQRLRNGFQKGEVLSTLQSVKQDNYSKVHGNKLIKGWEFLDENKPNFYEYPYRLAKYTALKGEPKVNKDAPFCIIEIHVSDATSEQLDQKFKFSVYVNTGCLVHLPNTTENSPMTKIMTQTCRFTGDSDEALATYAKLYKMYTLPPHSMTKWPQNEIIPPHIGSSEFQVRRELIITSQQQLDNSVIELVEHLWSEAIGCIEDIVTVGTSITPKQVDQAEGILLEIRKLLDKGNSDDDIQKLSEKYFDIIKYKQIKNLHSKSALAQQHELLQLLRDVSGVSEAAGKNSSSVAKYTALNCWISPLDKESEEFKTVVNVALPSENRDAIKIRNIFALRRPKEDLDFTHHLTNWQMLFHSSPLENFVGILSRGLLLPGIVAEERGDSWGGLLGSGIYFSDSFSKSASYSAPSKTSGSRMMALARVALGKAYETKVMMPHLKLPPDGYDSVHGISCPDSSFQANEFVIFQPNQQRLTHLIEFYFENDKIHPIKPLSAKNKSMPKVDLLGSPQMSHLPIGRVEARERLHAILALKDQVRLVQAGLQTMGKEPIQLESVHIRARLVDLASKVVIIQQYVNRRSTEIEAKYVFPMDDLAAVCGFEAFINDRHVVGNIQEKAEAHRQYREAVQQGHGAYLMDQEEADVFSVSIGNLPSNADVLIKITYVAELKVEGERIVFELPSTIANFRSEANEDGTIGVRHFSEGAASLEIGIEMPYLIRGISSPTNAIRVKRSDTMATVQLLENEDISKGFHLWINFAEIHVPRMWVEESDSNKEPEACMLAFYPSFLSESCGPSTLIIILDASNSMRDGGGMIFQEAQTIALLCLHHLDPEWKFNVILFGSVWEELFPCPQEKSAENWSLAEDFILAASANFGCTDLRSSLEQFFLITPPTTQDCEIRENIFVISDGNIGAPHSLLFQAKKHRNSSRMFTLGVGSHQNPCNHHLMKRLASVGSGAYEYFSPSLKFKWESKVKEQLQKASQPVLTDILVDWQQFNNETVPPVQAPKQIMSLFHGSRQVIYGFVPHCTMATLKAKIKNTEVSTVVCTTELSKTRGKILHRLTARAIIRDWVDGILDEDPVKDEAIKLCMKSDIVSMSKEYGILTPLTSYIAIEERSKTARLTFAAPPIKAIVDAENVDRLSYIEYPDESSSSQIPRTLSREPIQQQQEQQMLPTKKKKRCSKKSEPLGLYHMQAVRLEAEAIDCTKETMNERGVHKCADEIVQNPPTVRQFAYVQPSAPCPPPGGLFGAQNRSAPLFGSPSPAYRGTTPAPVGFSFGMPASSASVPTRFEIGTTTSPVGASFGARNLVSDSINPMMAKLVGNSASSAVAYGFGMPASLTSSSPFNLPMPTAPMPTFRFGMPSTSRTSSSTAAALSMATAAATADFEEQDEDFPTAQALRALLLPQRGGGYGPPDPPAKLKTLCARKCSPPKSSSTLSKRHRLRPTVKRAVIDLSASSDEAAWESTSQDEDLVAQSPLGELLQVDDEDNDDDYVMGCGIFEGTDSETAETSETESEDSSSGYYLSQPSDLDEDVSRPKRARPSPLEQEHQPVLGKQDEDLCSAILKALTESASPIRLTGNLSQLLRTGRTVQRELDLVQLLEKVNEENIELHADLLPPSSNLQKSNAAFKEIWKRQDPVYGSFSLSEIHRWTSKFNVRKTITRVLDEAGLKSMGLTRESILNMCATLIALFATCPPDGTLTAESIIEMMASQFNPSVIAQIIKALVFVTWVWARYPLLLRSLELDTTKFGQTWETFIRYCLKIE